MAKKMRAYSKKLYSTEQRNWCRWYECVTGFEPCMGEYEAGQKTFNEMVEWNHWWFNAWVKETKEILRHGPPTEAKA